MWQRTRAWTRTRRRRFSGRAKTPLDEGLPAIRASHRTSDDGESLERLIQGAGRSGVHDLAGLWHQILDDQTERTHDARLPMRFDLDALAHLERNLPRAAHHWTLARIGNWSAEQIAGEFGGEVEDVEAEIALAEIWLQAVVERHSSYP